VQMAFRSFRADRRDLGDHVRVIASGGPSSAPGCTSSWAEGSWRSRRARIPGRGRIKAPPDRRSR
jgi:hypothetical protein